MVKINIGSGKETKEGFDGIDIIDFGQKYILDVREGLPFEDDSVDEVYSRFFLPHLTNYNGKLERVKFFNELYRVMKPKSKALIIVPSWNSNGGYGNPLFYEPFYEGAIFFLNKEWREINAPGVKEYTCNFQATWGYGLQQHLLFRNQEYQQNALRDDCNATHDIQITLEKL